jgi:hypothetical protein
VLDHFEGHVGKLDVLALHETLAVSAVSVSIHIIAPGKLRSYRTLFTCGVSELPLNAQSKKRGGRYAELMIKLPPEWRVDRESSEADDKALWPVQWLRMCAHRIHDHNIWLGEGRIVIGPKTVPDDWRFAGFLIAPSDLPNIAAKGRRDVTIYSVRPVYASEIALAEQRGVETLIKLWNEANMTDVHSETRQSIT